MADSAGVETRIHLSPPDVGEGERAAILRAFDSGWVAPAGPELTAFEDEVSEMTGWPGAVALASGSAGLHLALMTHGVGPGDLVLVPTFTFAATAFAVSQLGAEPCFIDSEPASWNMSPELLAAELTECRRRNRLPKAVVVVDLYGQCADYEPIVRMCRELGVAVIEDAAEGIGASYFGRPAGTLGDVGVFSFNGNKIITTSGGGMLVAPTVEMADRIRYLATQARQPVLHYEHTEVGFNYRMSNLLAALGRAQLERLPTLMACRRAVNDRYRQQLRGVEGVSFMPLVRPNEWNGWMSCVVFDDTTTRDRVLADLARVGIESRPLWNPMHLQPVYAGFRARLDGTAEHLYRHGLCLPSGSSLTPDQVDEVASIVAAGARSSLPSIRLVG